MFSTYVGIVVVVVYVADVVVTVASGVVVAVFVAGNVLVVGEVRKIRQLHQRLTSSGQRLDAEG